MSRVKIVLFLLSFVFVGCSQRPVFTVEILKTPTVFTSFTPLESTPTFNPPPQATFTSPPSISATPNLEFSPVLYAFQGSHSHILLGGVTESGQWLSTGDAAARFQIDGTYDFFSPRQFAGMIGRPLEFSPTCQNYFLGASDLAGEAMVGVATNWIMEKRETRELATDDAAYVQVVSEWFQSQGIAATEIRLHRIVQADIEGDGVDEIFLSAAYFRDVSGHSTEAGDYSVVLMRKVEGNNVLTVPIILEYYASGSPELSFPQTYTLIEALDLDQDGSLEVIVEVSRWEGGGAIVYRVNGQTVQEVIRAIC